MDDELEEFRQIEQQQLESLEKKYSRLEKKIEDYKLENRVLKNRLDNTEQLLSILCKKLNLDVNTLKLSNDNFPDVNSSTDLSDSNNNNNNAINEMTWLYYIPKGLVQNTIVDKLALLKLETKIVDIDCIDTLDKKNIIAKLLECIVPKNIDLINRLYEKGSVSNEYILYRDILIKAFNSLSKSIKNVILIVKNFPSNSKIKHYDSIVDNIGVLTGVLNEVWSISELNDKFNKLALLIECDKNITKLKVKYKQENMVMLLEQLFN